MNAGSGTRAVKCCLRIRLTEKGRAKVTSQDATVELTGK